MKDALALRAHGFMDWGWVFFIGVALAVLSVMIISDLTFGSFDIILWTGFAIVFIGIFRIYIAFTLRRLEKYQDIQG
jgi:uncharacterized membrane protein HdeD (DUF308 family)